MSGCIGLDGEECWAICTIVRLISTNSGGFGSCARDMDLYWECFVWQGCCGDAGERRKSLRREQTLQTRQVKLRMVRRMRLLGVRRPKLRLLGMRQSNLWLRRLCKVLELPLRWQPRRELWQRLRLWGRQQKKFTNRWRRLRLRAVGIFRWDEAKPRHRKRRHK